MADELNTPGKPAAATTPAVSPPVQTVPADYEELRTFRDTYAPTLEAIAPYYDDIRPIVEDEETRNFLREARTTYQKRRDEQKPKLTPELELIRDEFKSTLTPLVEYVDGERKSRLEEQESKNKATQAEAVAYAQRLAAERPDLAEKNYAGIYLLASYAQREKITLEQAWKDIGSSFSAPQKRAEPPRSLRGDSGAPGVPGESKEPPIRGPKDLRSRLAANLRAGGMKG